MSSHSGSKAILYAFLANLGIAIAKTITSIITGSGSMMAEAIHSYADTGNQILLFIGLHRSQKPSDEIHPLGYGKAAYFWSFIVAILLFSIGGLYSIYEGVHKLIHPGKLDKAYIALLVLGFSILLEGGSLLGALKEIKKLRKNKSLFSWVKTSSRADLVVVLGEDFAAITGLMLAFIFIWIGMITENPIFDAIGSVAIGFVLIMVSILISLKIKSLIIGQAASVEIKSKIEEIIKSEKNIQKVFNVITMYFGHTLMVAAKINFSPEISVKDASKIINKIEVEIKNEFPEVEYTFIEPDITDL